ncbi:MAG: biotin--[acetyl-CoA-carboxylase] ligase [Chthoniobacterales bacterium]
MSDADPRDRLDAEKIQAALANQRIGARVLVLAETTSTNDILAQEASRSSAGLVVFAETQTAARGQYGRRWESAAHCGLWLSVLLRPKISVNQSARLTELLAHVIATTIEQQSGIACAIKPPNDIYASNRKLAGVLVEMRVEASGDYAAIAGLGINLNHASEDFPAELRATAGSVAMIAGRRFDRTDFAIALLRELEARYFEKF